MDEREQQAERSHELHDFGKTPQIVFLLHDFPDWRFLYERENLAEYVAIAVMGRVWPEKERNESIFRKKQYNRQLQENPYRLRFSKYLWVLIIEIRNFIVENK